MKIKKLWAIYITNNPSFTGEPDSIIKLSVRGFRKFFDETYSHAHTQGWNEGLAACKSHMEQLKREKAELQHRLEYTQRRLQQRDEAGRGGGNWDVLKDIFGDDRK